MFGTNICRCGVEQLLPVEALLPRHARVALAMSDSGRLLSGPVGAGAVLAGRRSWRSAIVAMRAALRGSLKIYMPDADFSYLSRQRGMFSYTGFNAAQVLRL